METILVTGGCGFLGRALIEGLKIKYDNVNIKTLSRSENNIVKTVAKCGSNRLYTIIGDIRDKDALEYALRDVDTVVHLAAMKHIDLCESSPGEAIDINVVGTINILKYFKGRTFVAMSTDKAVGPLGCYGATKLLMEKLVLQKAKENPDKRYILIRSGNIFGSSGSVIEKWAEQLREHNEITITDPNMTRFFTHVNNLVEFIMDVMEKGENGYIYIPNQKALRLEDLVNVAVSFLGNKNVRIKTIGPRKSERLHEDLYKAGEPVITDLTNESSQNAERMSLDEIINLLIDQGIQKPRLSP